MAIVPTRDPLVGSSSGDRALSDEADQLRNVSWFVPASNSFSFDVRLERIIASLDEAYRSAQHDGWDGYGGRKADASAYNYALDFMVQMPWEIPLPNVYIDSDGDVALEWDDGPRWVVSVRVGKDGTINYAALFGYSSVHGHEVFTGDIPDDVIATLERYVRRRRSTS
jgi:hypothetical protein